MAVPDPMVLYRKLTSGDAAAIASVGTALGEVETSIRTAADKLTEGATTAATHWTGDARTAFLTEATSSASDTADVQRRTRAAGTVLHRTANAYRELHKAADAAIRPWRAAGDGDPALALQVHRELMAAQHKYEAELAALAAGLDPADSEWSDLAHVGDDLPWIPQGLAYRADLDQLLVTSYNESKDAASQSRLTLLDNATGTEQKHVDLGGLESGSNTAPPNHAGGVATHGDNVWVTSTVNNDDGTQTNQVYVYSQADIDRARSGATVHPKQVVDVPASSYITYADDKLWIGQYSRDGDPKLYSFDVGADGSIGDVTGEYPTPQHVQGVVVRDDEFVFSQSDGESGSSYVTQDRDWTGIDFTDPSTWSPTEEYRLGENEDGDPIHGVEEIEEIDGEIVSIHESGAHAYPDDHAHHDDLTRTPLTALGLDSDDGYETDPAALTSAAGLLDASADALQHAADLTGRLQLVARVLGDVPSAGPFSTVVTRYLADRGRDLGDGAQTVRATADGLHASAETYRRLEDVISFGLGSGDGPTN